MFLVNKNYKTKAVIGTFGMAIALAFSIVSYSAVVVLQGALCEQMGYTQEQFSLFFSMRSVGTFVMSFVLGKLVTKIGAKMTVIIGSFGSLIGFAAMAVCDSVYVLWIIGFVVGAMSAMPGFVTFNIFVSRWFNQGRGTMMSIGTIVMYAVSILGVPMIASANTTLGVTSACLGVGVIFTGVSLLCGLFAVCKFPEDYGTTPVDIGKPAAAAQQTASQQQNAYEPKLPATALLKLPATILCLLIPALMSVGSQMVMAYSVNIYQSFGMDYMTASLCMSISSFGGVFISPIFGILCDKIGTKKSITIYGVLGFLSCVLIPLLLDGWVAGVAFAIMINVSCFSNMYMGLVMPSIFGRQQSPILMGWGGTVQGVLGIFAAPLAMLLYSINGSYMPVLVACGVTFLASVVLNYVVMSPSTPEKVKELDAAYAGTKK